MGRRTVWALAGALLVLALSACGTGAERAAGPVSTPSAAAAAPDPGMEAEAPGAAQDAAENEKTPDGEAPAEEGTIMLRMTIGETPVEVDWEENASVEALKELCREQPLTVAMSMYGGFEQVGSLGTSLPRNDVQTTTGSGDIVLYSGDQVVLFYGTNAWAYTRLGHVSDPDADMEAMLGHGDVTVTFRLTAEY